VNCLCSIVDTRDIAKRAGVRFFFFFFFFFFVSHSIYRIDRHTVTLELLASLCASSSTIESSSPSPSSSSTDGVSNSVALLDHHHDDNDDDNDDNNNVKLHHDALFAPKLASFDHATTYVDSSSSFGDSTVCLRCSCASVLPNGKNTLLCIILRVVEQDADIVGDAAARQRCDHVSRKKKTNFRARITTTTCSLMCCVFVRFFFFFFFFFFVGVAVCDRNAL
jgi:hypothetical protein